MQQGRLQLNVVSALVTIKACANAGVMLQGMWVHDEVIKVELDTNVLVEGSLVNMYCKCGGLYEARRVFDGLSKQSSVSWGAMITGYVDYGHSLCAIELFGNMQRLYLKPTRATYLAILKACAGLGVKVEGKLIHHQILDCGFESDQMLQSSLVDMYAKCGFLNEACMVFEGVSKRDIVLWGAMIEAYAEHGKGSLALDLLKRMKRQGVKPNRPIFLSSLKACNTMPSPCEGMMLHNNIIKDAFESDIVIGSCLVDMYAKCCCLEEARRIFDKLSQKSVIPWSTMIAGYAEHGYGDCAFELFNKMKAAGIAPDKVTHSGILKACICLQSLEQGREVHEDIKKSRLQVDVVVGTALVDMYSKCGSVEEARNVFDEMPERNELTWGAMISGYAQHGHGFPALELFEAMQEEGLKANKVIFLSVIKACGSIGTTRHGRWIHMQVIIQNMVGDAIVGNALVDMYAKCGSLKESYNVFLNLKVPDVASWSSIVTGLAQHGGYTVARCLIEAMEHQGVKPNHAIFASFLSACSRSGVAQEGCKFFEELRAQNLLPSFEQYSCMIDLFGRGGLFDEAEDVFKTMPTLPTSVAEMSLLTHHQTFSNAGTKWNDSRVSKDPPSACVEATILVGAAA